MKLHQTRDRLDVHIADLSGSVFNDVNLSGATFENVNLSGTTLTDVNVSGWRISNANLAGLRITCGSHGAWISVRWHFSGASRLLPLRTVVA